MNLGTHFIAIVGVGLIVAFVADASHAKSPNPSIDPATNETVAQPLSVRMADGSSKEVPDFQRHITPLLGRLGCNGRACHGSFQGRGDFQLSLFGYDFRADHAALLDPDTGRVDTDDVGESLILAKPTDADMHEGGKRLDVGSWQYHTLRNWIAAGASFETQTIDALDRLEIQPSEIQFQNESQSVSLTAIAHWADGTREDVTDLCRFTTNDDAIADIDEHGLVSSGETGDTHVVIAYDRAVVPIPVIRRVAIQESIPSPEPSDHPIDQLIQVKLDKLGITPSNLCDDSDFIRRASLDITGTLPAAADVRAFLADTRPDKRERLVDELLDSPGYAAWWATRLADWTGNSDVQLNNALPVRGSASRLWYEWLRVRLEDNLPYDQIVEGIVMADNREEDESYLQYCKTMTDACRPGNESQFAERSGMPLYWARRNFQKPEERAIGFAYSFLGIRIECAQCHKHPFDQWSKDDFDQFAKLFKSIEARPNTVARDSREQRDQLISKITGQEKLRNGDLRRKIYKAAQQGETVPFPELVYNTAAYQAQKKRAKARAKKNQKAAPISIPEGLILGQSDSVALDRDPRGDLMAWLRQDDNPYFAKAIVNRVWANYFGIGIINPTDDMNLANAPSNAELLDELAKRFIDSGYDLKWLSREITTSDAYQRSMDSNASNRHDDHNFARHVPRRLPAEVIHDAVLLATQSSEEADRMRGEMQQMAIANGVTQNRNNRSFALQVFGQSERESNCDCDRSDSPSLLQSIYLRNDFEMYRQLGSKDGWVTQTMKSLGLESGDAGVDPQIQRRAELFQRQTIAKLKRFQRMTPKQRRTNRDRIREEYGRVQDKLERYGFASPGLAALLDDPDAWELERIESDKDNAPETSMDQVVDDAYLRTLSRYPDDGERETSLQFIAESKSPQSGLESLMWALVNTKEFIITH
ncbi:DUF1549 and DUF1553 domain-containing protein [Rhodopirellula bahusiensis]|uniref:BIG2 domain-containing protein n=1 Tax=Rhodopirellula bahusiensis TaxID=2014065 RepID=A0A2G1VYM8_9BACT|nr:hypothetical protein CEE69_28850 [Rhodopirellula bahusiensis]